ncbi:unnamed protein product, partial [marine sediment metagenome]
FKYPNFGVFIPPHTNPRITAQSGVFTIDPSPDNPYKGSEGKLEKLIIVNKNNLRGEIKKMLYHYGIHEASLFPGLDTLTRHIEWMGTYKY